jgi:hypothetical protein
MAARPFTLCPDSYDGMSIYGPDNGSNKKRIAVRVTLCDKNIDSTCATPEEVAKWLESKVFETNVITAKRTVESQ